MTVTRPTAAVGLLLLIAITPSTRVLMAAQEVPITAGRLASPSVAEDVGLVPLTLTTGLDPPCGAFRVARLEADPAGQAPWRFIAWSRVAIEGDASSIVGRAGVTTLLLLQCEERPGYALHGPLTWPTRPATDEVSPILRRTVRGNLPSASPSPPVVISFSSDGGVSQDRWPSCRLTTPSSWECIGVSLDETTLVVFPQPVGLLYGIAFRVSATVQQVDVQAARWGRALRIEATGGAPANDWQVVARRVRASQAVPDAVRPIFEIDDRIVTIPIAPQTYWIAGQDESARTIVDISGPGSGRMSVPVAELREGSPELLMTVRASDSVSLRGTVLDDLDEPVPGALVSLYEPVTFERRATGAPPPPVYKRWIADDTTGADGGFTFEGLSRQRYDALAGHATLGRGEGQAMAGSGLSLRLRLVKPPQVRGRVVRDGRPQAGVPVRLLPASSVLPRGSDLSRYAGVPTVTDTDGRFSVGVPAQGTSQLVIGSGGTGVLRRQLPESSVMAPMTDLGDLVLPGLTEVLVQVDLPALCDLLAAGPMGAPGLSVVKGGPHPSGLLRLELPEPGFWIVSLVCEGREVRLTPPFIEASGSDERQIVRLQVVPDR